MAHTPELEGWILHWGEYCQVLEPAELRESVRQRLQATAALYR